MNTGALWHDLPSHWSVGQVKNLATVTLGKMLQSSDSGGDVHAPYMRAANVQPDGALQVDDVKEMWFSPDDLEALNIKHGDVVVVEGGQGGFGRAAYVNETLEGWGFQNSINRLRLTDGNDGRFLAYCLIALRESGYIRAYCNVVSMPHLTAEKLSAVPVPLPPIPEQRVIADYLDHEIAQIDTLVEEQQRLIELFSERRAATIDRIVWQGLESAEMAPTGMDSVSAAPAHWRRLRNKNLLAESTMLSKEGSEELLTVSHLTGITPRSEKTVNMIEAESLVGYRLVQSGDLIINTMWAWMGALGISRLDGVVSPAYGVYRPLPGAGIDPTYFDYLYRSRPYVVEMTRHSRGIWESRLRLYPDVFLRLPIVLPPLDEQRAIAAYLVEQTAKVDTLIAEAERFIELARERRSALITEAVTGQIDVLQGVS